TRTGSSARRRTRRVLRLTETSAQPRPTRSTRPTSIVDVGIDVSLAAPTAYQSHSVPEQPNRTPNSPDVYVQFSVKHGFVFTVKLTNTTQKPFSCWPIQAP